jgi:CBS domain containing-hemolysin-like protein
MDQTDTVWRLAAVRALVLANGFFVAAEFAIVTVRKTRIDQLIAEGVRRAAGVRDAITEPDRFIAATQVGITMTSLGLGWLGEPAVARTIDPLVAYLPGQWGQAGLHSISFGISFAIITSLHVVCGELAPKTIALQQPEKTALLVTGPTRLFMRALWPFIALLNGLGARVVRLLGLRPPSGHSMVHSEEELKMLVTASQEAGVLEEDEEQMLHRVFGFGDLTAGHVMVPRTEMNGIRADATLAQLIDQVSRQPHAWLPVLGKGMDDILGFLHVEDVFPALRQPPEAFRVTDYLREAVTVPETLKADEVLEEMKRRGIRHAVVIDEYGGTAGLVTFEGLMERIVGEVGSEFSAGRSRISVLPDGSAMVDGLALTTDVNEQFGLHIDEDVYTTVGGFVLGMLGRRARLGDRVEVEGRTLRVEALDGLRVARVHLSKKQDPGRITAPSGASARSR